MDTSAVIYLLRQTYAADTIGQQIATEIPVKRYCRVTSVSREEFWDAGRSGHQPSFRMIMDRFEYHGERELLYNDRCYTVYRTYAGTGDTIDLYVEERVGDES